MLKTILTKILSILTSATLLIPSFAGNAGAISAPPAAAVPEFVKAFTPPSRLGFLDSYYQGRTERPVILIEDLHANYGVQKKIMGILKRLQLKIAQGGRPMVLGMEAASGDVDLAFIRKEDIKVREAVGEFLLKQAAITGVEHFAAMSPVPVRLVGIDSGEDYLLHHELFTKSLGARLSLAYKVDALRQVIDPSKKKAPRGLKKLWKLEEDFHAGTIDLPELAQELGVPELRNYGEAEALLNQRKLAASEQYPEKSFYLKNLVSADQDLALLSRLLRQQMTLEEVQFVAKKVPEMVVVLEALLPGQPVNVWKDTIQAAIDYYAVALLRDKTLAEHAYKLAQENPDVSVVAVTGGFHTAGIAQILKQRQVSYVALAPIVESHTTHDEVLYLERMLELPLDEHGVALDVKTPTASPTLAARTYYTTFRATVINRLLPAIREGVLGRAAGAAAPVRERDLLPALLRPYSKPGWRDFLGSFRMRDLVENIMENGLTLRGASAHQIKKLYDRFSDDHAVSGSGVYIYNPMAKAFGRPFNFSQFLTTKAVKGQRYIIRRGMGESGPRIEIIPEAFTPARFDIAEFSNENWGFQAYRDGSSRTYNVFFKEKIGQALAAMGMTVDGFKDIKYQYWGLRGGYPYLVALTRIAFLPDYSLQSPEETRIDRKKGIAYIHYNPRLLEPGFENALLGAIIKGLVNVTTTEVGSGESKELRTIPQLFQYWVTAIGVEAVRNALDIIGEGAFPLKELFELTIERIVDENRVTGRALFYGMSPSNQGILISTRLRDSLGQLMIRGTLHKIEEEYKRKNDGRSFLYDEHGNERDLFPVPMGPAGEKGVSRIMSLVNLVRNIPAGVVQMAHGGLSHITLGLIPHHDVSKQRNLEEIRRRFRIAA